MLETVQALSVGYRNKQNQLRQMYDNIIKMVEDDGTDIKLRRDLQKHFGNVSKITKDRLAMLKRDVLPIVVTGETNVEL